MKFGCNLIQLVRWERSHVIRVTRPRGSIQKDTSRGFKIEDAIGKIRQLGLTGNNAGLIPKLWENETIW